MKIPADAILADEKLSKYLLVPRPWDDKSQFLARAGFSLTAPEALRDAILKLSTAVEAAEDGVNEYGVFYRVEGNLQGPNGVTLPVVLVWLQWYIDGTMHFVTLKPAKV